MKRILVLVTVLIMTTLAATGYAQVDKNAAILKADAEKTFKERQMNVGVEVTLVAKVPNSDNFGLYKLSMLDKSNNQKASQYILFNGKYTAQDLMDIENNISVLRELMFQHVTTNVTAAGLTNIYGNANAKNQIIIITDFRCSFCIRSHDVLTEIVATKKDTGVFVMHLPRMSEQSEILARIFEAGMMQNVNFAGELYTNNDLKKSTEIELVDYFAKKVKDADKFKKDVVSVELGEKLREYAKIAADHDIGGTPSFFVNGKIIEGLDTDLLMRALEGK